MNAQLKNLGIRKAAIFVASLDRATADLVLERFAPEQARLVREAMVGLDEVDPREQERVLEEFRRGEAASRRPAAGIDLEGPLPRPGRPQPAAQPEPPAPPAPPFCFLREAETDKLAKILAGERPQVIALVLSHLPPEQAGKVLIRLSSAAQVDVIRRLVDLEEADPEILREVERGIEHRLSELVRMQRRRVAGFSAVAGILEAADQRIGMQILDNLARYDRFLAERLSPGQLQVGFEDLLAVDDRTLAAVLAAADLELVALALIGAPPEWTERLLGVLPDGEAQWARDGVANLGPVRLSDVEEARRRLADLARRLAIEGKIELTRAAQPLAA